MASQAATDQVDLLASGEMGIGNTTASTALFSILLDLPVEETVNRLAEQKRRMHTDILHVIQTEDPPLIGGLKLMY